MSILTKHHSIELMKGDEIPTGITSENSTPRQLTTVKNLKK